MKKINFKGSALLQVLVLSALIATIVVVLLKFSITRTSNMVQTKHVVSSELAVQGCMSMLNEEEVNRLNNGLLPYFEDPENGENPVFYCSFSNYGISITRGEYKNNNMQDHSIGIVRPLNFKIEIYNSSSTEDPDADGI